MRLKQRVWVSPGWNTQIQMIGISSWAVRYCAVLSTCLFTYLYFVRRPNPLTKLCSVLKMCRPPRSTGQGTRYRKIMYFLPSTASRSNYLEIPQWDLLYFWVFLIIYIYILRVLSKPEDPGRPSWCRVLKVRIQNDYAFWNPIQVNMSQAHFLSSPASDWK